MHHLHKLCLPGVPKELHCALLNHMCRLSPWLFWHQLYFWNTRTPKWGKRWKTANGVDGYCRHIALTWFELEQCRHWNNCRNWSTSYRKVWEGRNVLRKYRDLLDKIGFGEDEWCQAGGIEVHMSSSRSSRLKTLSDKQFYIKLY